jgi:hypothetical protein
VVAADQDESGAGERAAKKAAGRFWLEGRAVTIFKPHEIGDFNDLEVAP